MGGESQSSPPPDRSTLRSSFKDQLKSKILENSEVETIIGIPKTHWKDIPISENLDKYFNVTVIARNSKIKNKITHINTLTLLTLNLIAVILIHNVRKFTSTSLCFSIPF